MTDDQLDSLAERFVLSFEKIAVALAGLYETYQKEFEKRYPERGSIREAVVTRVPNEEDEIRAAHGASTRPISEWLSDIEKEEEQDIGVREREWLSGHARIPGGAAGAEGDA